MRLAPTIMLSSNNYGVRFQDGERAIDTYLPIDEDGYFTFPERAPDFEVDGYPVFFKGYGKVQVRWNVNGTDSHVARVYELIKNVRFGSRMLADEFVTPSYPGDGVDLMCWGGLVAIYEIPSFWKFQFNTKDAVFWKHDDDLVADLYRIPCYQYNYILEAPFQNDEVFAFEGHNYKAKSIKDYFDFDTEFLSDATLWYGITAIENNMTVDHYSFVIKQTTPLKKFMGEYASRLHGFENDECIWNLLDAGDEPDPLIITPDDQCCIVYAYRERSSGSHDVRTSLLYPRFVFDKNDTLLAQSGYTRARSTLLDSDNLIEVASAESEFLFFENLDDPVNGFEVTTRVSS